VIPPVVDKGYSIAYRYSRSVPSGVPAVPLTEYNIAVGTTKQIASVPALTGYLFIGWSTKDVVVSGNSFTMPNNDVLFTGQWISRNYTVQYDLNGGNPDIASRVNISWGTSNLLPASIPEKANYTFGGWYYNDINVTNIHKYSDLAANEDILSITLQAKWVLTDNHEITEKTGEWALVNLILSILGVILVIIAITRALHWNNQEDQDKKTQKISGLAKISFIITILLGIIGIAVFLITQDLTTTMMIISDKWTILHAAILIIETLTLLIALKKTTTNNSEDQQKAAP
jgi:uncharacterized repeat protein (TIGR02543 family)